MRVLKVNSKEWWLIALGIFFPVLHGMTYPAFAVLLGGVLDVFIRPADDIIRHLHLRGALFLVVGAVIGVSLFFKVHMYMYML